MPKKIDLAGQLFGRLTVIEEAGRNKWGKVKWMCRCSCGNYVVVDSGSLRSGNTKSCGCYNLEVSLLRSKKDLTGKRFGRLTVVGESAMRRGRVRWECVCDCGGAASVETCSLNSGHTTSCGCFHRERMVELNRKWESSAEMNRSPITKRSVLFGKIPKCDNPAVERGGVVSVTCKMCGTRFTPTRGQVQSRVKSFEGKKRGESNFYCSDLCKGSCPVYRAQPQCAPPSLRKPKSVTAKIRACQPNALKQIQCDENNGQSHCERCGDLIDVELHHTLPVAEYGEDAINPAGHMLLCAGCHVTLHRECV